MWWIIGAAVAGLVVGFLAGYATAAIQIGSGIGRAL